jgi:hypothetical protein
MISYDYKKGRRLKWTGIIALVCGFSFLAYVSLITSLCMLLIFIGTVCLRKSSGNGIGW